MGSLKNKMKAFANKIEGVSIVDNMANPNSAASKMAQSVKTPAQQKRDSLASKMRMANPSNGIGVGP